MENVSNRNGRALEYRIVDELMNEISKNKVKLTERAQLDQIRDYENYRQLQQQLRTSYSRCAQLVFSWLDDEFSIGNDSIIIDRLTDQDARRGDVTDIRILTENGPINLSIKHNHTALKHQRPPSTAQWCGFSKGSKADLKFRDLYGQLLKSFLSNASQSYPKAQNFRDIKAMDPTFIDKYLYYPVCKLVAAFINWAGEDPNVVEHLFGFLVGNTNFYKIIDFNDQVHIYEFANIQYPRQVRASCRSSNYVDLEFSNGWEISMRIHTAASAIGNSLKFDTQPGNIAEVVPRVVILKTSRN